MLGRIELSYALPKTRLYISGFGNFKTLVAEVIIMGRHFG
jgi:hypothetical protein